VFSLGLSMTVAPLTAAILADADEHNAGIASGVNNAVARVAGVLAIAVLSLLFIGVYDAALRDAASSLGTLPAALLEPLSGEPLPAGAAGEAGRAALFGAFQAVAVVGAACAAGSGLIAWRMMR
jgi:hypothetical protein